MLDKGNIIHLTCCSLKIIGARPSCGECIWKAYLKIKQTGFFNMKRNFFSKKLFFTVLYEYFLNLLISPGF